MAWTKTKVGLVAGAAIFLALGAIFLLVHWTQRDKPLPRVISRVDSDAAGKARSIAGIGAVLSFDAPTKTLRITKVLPNSPAAEAGVPEGSIVQKIDDIPTASFNLAELVERIRGPVGTKVRLELTDLDGKNAKTIELTRQNVKY